MSEDPHSQAETETSDAASADSSGGRRVGQYRLKRQIASGGMGKIYEAVQDNPRRTVAVKLMRPGIAAKSALRRFEHESQLLARLRHPGIAQVFEAGTHKDAEGETVPFFAMEYVPGASLITDYASKKSLGTRERVGLFIQVCDAVHHGHQKSIIHRDLKPGNILVDSSGAVKVIDFGVARSTDSDMAAATMQTEIGQLIGTLQYMSPEQCEGDPHDIDTRSDVYALGVVLYELLTGRLPYEVSSGRILESTRVIRNATPTRLSSIDHALRGDLEAIVFKALEKDRERRYQSAHELGEDLRRYLSGEAVTARPPSFVYQLRVFSRRNKGLIAALAAVLLVLVGGVAVSTAQYLRAEAARVEAEAVTRFLSDSLISASPRRGMGREATVLEYVDQAAERIEEEFQGQPLLAARIHLTIGNAYHDLSRYDRAEAHFRAAVTLREQVLGKGHPLVAHPLQRLGLSVFKQGGRMKEAEGHYRRALEIRQTHFGEKDPGTLNTLSGLGLVLMGQHRSGEAEEVLTRALEGLTRTLGEDHISTAYAMGHLASALMNQKKQYERAEALTRKALEVKRRVYGERNPATLIQMTGLAVLLDQRGRHEEAEALFRETLETRREVLGDDHWDTSRSYEHLNSLLRRQGRTAEADRLLRQELEGLTEILGEEHPRTLRAMKSLGDALMESGHYEEAEAVFRKALEIQRRVSGGRARATLALVNDLGWALNELERYEEAETLHREALEARREALGEDHLDTLVSSANLGLSLRGQEKLAEAEPFLRQAAEGSMRTLEEAHPTGIWIKREHATLLADQGRIDEARPYALSYLRGERARAEETGSDPGNLNEHAWSLLVCPVEDLRDPRTALDFARRAAGMPGGRRANILDTLALALFETGDRQRAIEVQKEAVTLLPPGPSPVRTELEGRLARFTADGR